MRMLCLLNVFINLSSCERNVSLSYRCRCTFFKASLVYFAMYMYMYSDPSKMNDLRFFYSIQLDTEYPVTALVNGITCFLCSDNFIMHILLLNSIKNILYTNIVRYHRTLYKSALFIRNS